MRVFFINCRCIRFIVLQSVSDARLVTLNICLSYNSRWYSTVTYKLPFLSKHCFFTSNIMSALLFCCTGSRLILDISCVVLQGYTTWRTHSSSASSGSSEPPAADFCPFSESVGHYNRLVQCGSLREDAQQRHVLQQLVHLQQTLSDYSNNIYLIPPPPTLNSKDEKVKDSCITTAENKVVAPAEKVK